MAIIDIDPNLQKSDEIASYFDFLTQQNRISAPEISLDKILLSKSRTGLDADITSQSIISRFDEIGIPNGTLGDGSPNVLEGLVRIIIEEIYDAIQNEMRIDVAVDSGMIVESFGASASGPVSSTGSNPSPAPASAIAS
jgi:hypothetical protein